MAVLVGGAMLFHGIGRSMFPDGWTKKPFRPAPPCIQLPTLLEVLLNRPWDAHEPPMGRRMGSP